MMTSMLLLLQCKGSFAAEEKEISFELIELPDDLYDCLQLSVLFYELSQYITAIALSLV